MATLLDRIRATAPSGSTVTIVDRRGVTAVRTVSSLLEEADGRAAAGGPSLQPVTMSMRFEAIVELLAAWSRGATALVVAPRQRIEPAARWEAARDRMVHAASVAVAEVGPAAIVRGTSGTTGEARIVVKSHGALVAQADSHAATKGGLEPRVDHRLGWTPLHRRGLGGDLLYPMAAGVDITLVDTERVTTRPIRWLEAIAEARATFSSAPTFAYALAARALEEVAPGALDLSCWRIAHCGGEVVQAAVLERFAVVAASHGFDPSALCPSYGLSETGGITARRGLAVDEVDRDELRRGRAVPSTSGVRVVSVGSTAPGVELRIVDPSGEVLGDRTVGEVQVITPAVSRGHVGWFATGDLGYLAGGELHLVGRAKDVVIVHGANLAATDVERAALGVPGVDAAAAVGVPDGPSEVLVLAVEATADVRDEVVRAVWRETGVAPRRVDVVPPGSLPRTDGGKLRRAEVRDRYLS